MMLLTLLAKEEEGAEAVAEEDRVWAGEAIMAEVEATLGMQMMRKIIIWILVLRVV